MSRRRGSSTTSMSRSSLHRNRRYITRLRRRIQDLEEEAAELSERLNMLLADVDDNMARNYDLRVLQLQVEQHLQHQDAPNLSPAGEIRQLRELSGEEAPAQAEAGAAQPMDIIGGPKPSTTKGGGDAAAAEDGEPPAPALQEAEEK